MAPGGGSYYTRLIDASAPSVSRSSQQSHRSTDAAEIERAIGEFVREPNGGLVVLAGRHDVGSSQADCRTGRPTSRTRHFLLSVASSADGGLISYGIDVVDQFRQAAGYVDRILKGAKPAELPVQLPTKFVMAINLKTAKALGLDVPLCAATRRRGGSNERVMSAIGHFADICKGATAHVTALG